LLIPSDTLVVRPEGTLVALVNANNVVHFQRIQVGRDFGDSIEVNLAPTPPPSPPTCVTIEPTSPTVSDMIGLPGNKVDGFKTAYMTRNNADHMWEAEAPGLGPYHVGWHVNAPEPGLYDLWVEYASPESRPMQVKVGAQPDAATVFVGLSHVTSGPANRAWFLEGQVPLQAGDNSLWFHSTSLPPNINGVRLYKCHPPQPH